MSDLSVTYLQVKAKLRGCLLKQIINRECEEAAYGSEVKVIFSPATDQQSAEERK